MIHGHEGFSHYERPRWQWWVLAGWIVSAYILGATGFWKYEVDRSGHGTLLDALYHSVQLFVLDPPVLAPPTNVPLELGRWLAVGLFFLAAVTAAYRVFSAEIRSIGLGLLRKHTIICGEGRIALDIVRNQAARRPRQPIVVIAGSEDSELIQTAYALGATVLVGPATELLRHSRLSRAQRVISVYDDDGSNVEIASKVHALSSESRPPNAPVLECFAQIADVDLRETLRLQHLMVEHARCDVRFFDVFNDAARNILLEQLPLDHEGIRAGDTRQVHLIIVGFGAMGRTFAIKAAQIAQFANGRKLRISVIDQDAEVRHQELLFRYPKLPEICELALESCPIPSIRARDLLDDWCADPSCVTSVVVCVEGDGLALELAMRLLPRAKAAGVEVAVRMSQRDGLTAILSGVAASIEGKKVIHTFGWCDEPCFSRLLGTDDREEMAAMVHAKFLELAVADDRTATHDEAVQTWKSLTNEDFRESSRQQVDHLLIKLRAVGCEATASNDPRPRVKWNASEIDFDLLAELEHRRWVAERLLAGWTYAPGKKDPSKRTNPNVVPWAELGAETKRYDYAAVENIPNLLAVRGQEIRRQPVRR